MKCLVHDIVNITPEFVNMLKQSKPRIMLPSAIKSIHD